MRLVLPIWAHPFFCLSYLFCRFFFSVEHAEIYLNSCIPFSELLGKTHSLYARSVVTAKFGRSTISGLLDTSRPLAVFFAVVAIIIDAVKRHVRRHCSHIEKKISKVLPPFAHRYSPPSIILERFTLRFCASPYHACPARIGGRAFSGSIYLPMTMLPTRRVCASLFSAQATATLRASFLPLKIRRVNNFLSAALAPTYPVTRLCSGANYG